MKLSRAGIAAGLLLTLLLTSLLALTSTPGRRALRAVDRRFGLTEAGRRAQFDALIYLAKQEFIQNAPEDQSDLRPVAYPTKTLLLQREAELLLYLREEERWRDFRADLLRALDPEVARPIVREWMADPDTCHLYGRSTEVLAVLPVGERKQIALEAPLECRRSAFYAVPVDARDEAFLQDIILQHAGATGIPWYVIGEPAGASAALSVYDQLSRAGKISLVHQLYRPEFRPPGGSPEAWLAQEWDPAVRQALLYYLKDFSGLMDAVERDGIFRETGFWSNWQFMKQMVAGRPDSFLARGITAYEAVRGKPYFHIDRDRRTGEYGNSAYDPEREIPGWEAWLKEFAGHEGADDAAYRLGRCYEITGQYDLALKWLEAATTLGDGDYAYAARGRIVWLLDALLSREQLSTLQVHHLSDGLKTARAYTIALRDLREGRYLEAAAELDALIGTAGDGADPLPVVAPNRSFWPGVREQRAKAARLAALKADTTPAGSYALAAAIYHDEDIFYNYLWGGGRQSAILFGYHLWALQGDMDPAYSRWIAESNNYAQAAEAFAALTDGPAPVAEKALYSRGLALMRVARHYGADVVLWKPLAVLEAEARAALEQVVERFPRGELAPDALLSLGYLTGNRTYFERLIKQYPRSAAAAEAEQAAPQPWFTSQWVPFRSVPFDEAPAAVADWARERLTSTGKAVLTLDGATWVLLTSGQPGQEGSVAAYSPQEGGLSVNAVWAPRPGAPGYALVRFDGLWHVQR